MTTDGLWFRFDRHTNRLMVTAARQMGHAEGGVLHLAQMLGLGPLRPDTTLAELLSTASTKSTRPEAINETPNP